MGAWNSTIQLFQWLATIAGGGLAVIGALLFFLSFGDNGTAGEKRSGLIMWACAAGCIAFAALVPAFFPAPPSY